MNRFHRRRIKSSTPVQKRFLFLRKPRGEREGLAAGYVALESRMMLSAVKWSPADFELVNLENPEGEPWLAAALDGRFTLTFFESFAGPPAYTDIETRLYTAAGTDTGLGVAPTFSSTTIEHQGASAYLSDNRQVFVWTEEPAAGGGNLEDVYASVYVGTLVSVPRFLVAGGADMQHDPVVATSTNGGFAIALADDSVAGGRVTLKFYNAVGTLVNTVLDASAPEGVYTPAGFEDDYRNVEIAGLANGNFVVTWSDDANFDIFARVYSSGGAALTGLIDVESAGSSALFPDATPLADGRFLITYEQTTVNAVRGRIYESNGTPSVGPFTITTNASSTTNQQVQSADLQDGRFVTVWRNLGGNIEGQVMFADGTPDGSVFAVNSDAAGAKGRPVVATLADGRFVVAWESGAGNSATIFATIFDARDVGLHGSASSFNDDWFGTNFDDQIYGGTGKDFIRGAAGADLLYGESGSDTLSGEAGNDRLYGGNLDDVLNGGADNDILNGGTSADTLNGEDGDDRLIGGTSGDALDGGAGNDTADYSSSSAAVSINLSTASSTGGDAEGDTFLSIERLTGSAFADSLVGNNLANILSGGNGIDTLNGGNGNDNLSGGSGNDRLIGGAGQDSSTGGDGADNFVFAQPGHTPVGALRDLIQDFNKVHLDKIDVSLIDGQTGTPGVDEFHSFIGNAAFSAEGQIRAFQVGNHTVIEFNTTGASVAEFQIQLNNFDASTLELSDFIVAIPPPSKMILPGSNGSRGGGYASYAHKALSDSTADSGRREIDSATNLAQSRAQPVLRRSALNPGTRPSTSTGSPAWHLRPNQPQLHVSTEALFADRIARDLAFAEMEL